MAKNVENKNVVNCVYVGEGAYLQPNTDRRVIPPLFDDYDAQRIYCPTPIEADEGLHLMYPEGVSKNKIKGFYDELLHMKETINCLHEGDELVQFIAIKRMDEIHGRIRGAVTIENGENLELLKELNEHGYDIIMNLNPLRATERIKPSTDENFFEDIEADMVAQDEDVKQIKYFVVRVNPIKVDGDDSECDVDYYFERTESEATAWRILRYLKNEMGFKTCFMACNGDSYHLIWRVDLDPTPENDKLLEKCLLALAYMFDTDCAYVDASPYNRNEQVRLYGTAKYAVPHTEKHPTCGTYIVHAPQKMEVVDKVKLEALAEHAPDDEGLIGYYQSEVKIEDYNSVEYKNEKFTIVNVLYYILNKSQRFSCPNDGTNYIQLGDDFGTDKFYELGSLELEERLQNECKRITGKDCDRMHIRTLLLTADSLFKLRDEYEEIRESGICPPVNIPVFKKVLYK